MNKLEYDQYSYIMLGSNVTNEMKGVIGAGQVVILDISYIRESIIDIRKNGNVKSRKFLISRKLSHPYTYLEPMGNDR